MRFSSISKSVGLLAIAVGLNATFMASPAFSQSAQDQGKVSGSPTGKANAITGGAEAAPTDQATPSSSGDTGATPSMSGNSGKGNTITGGAEGAPTDQATPAPATTTVPSGPSSRPTDLPPNMKGSQSE